MSRIVLVLYMFLILSQFTVTEVSQSIVLIMLTEVESHASHSRYSLASG